MGQWRYSLHTDKLSAAMQIAERVHSLAQAHRDAALLMEAYRALGVTLYLMGQFGAARQYTMQAVEIWRSGAVRSQFQEVDSQPVACLAHAGLLEWHCGETATCRATLAEAISLAKALNDLHGLAVALYCAGILTYLDHEPAEMDHLAAELIELTTHQNFAQWLALGAVYRGWARSALGDPTGGLAWIEDGIEDWRAPGSIRLMPFFLALKAEALYLANRTSEALAAIEEAEAAIESSEERSWRAELHRLKGVFLTAMGADETQIEASFCSAIRTAKEQKSVSLEKRAEKTYAEYRRQKASAPGGRGFRLPL
jgi:tetratricopeptide (TPR) repeat protein